MRNINETCLLKWKFILSLMSVCLIGWLVVFGFYATLTAKVISWQSVTNMCFLAFSHNFSFQSHRLLFSHAFAEVRGENTPERKFASTGDRAHNHQVMSLTPLSHPGGACVFERRFISFMSIFFLFNFVHE